MKKLTTILTVFTSLSGTSFLQADGASEPTVAVDWADFMGRHDLVMERLPRNWNGGSFEGNGLLASMVYQASENQICWQMGHAHAIQRQGKENGRMPIGRLFLNTVGTIESGSMRLDLWNAETLTHVVTDKGSLHIRSFIHSRDMVQAVTVKATGEESGASFHFTPGVALKKKFKHPWSAYMDGARGVRRPFENGEIWVTDRGEGGEVATLWKEVPAASPERLVLLTVVDSFPEKTAVDQGKDILASVESRAWNDVVASHRSWWHDYYPQSFLTVPHAQVETFYWLQMYKLACATRADRAVASTLGPWFRKTIWPRTWLNYNAQSFYSPFPGANRADMVKSLFHFLEHNEENMRIHAEHFYGTPDGLAVPPSAPHSGEWKLGRGRYENPGDVAWIMQVCWQYYRHTMDHSLVIEGDEPGWFYRYLRRVGHVYLKTTTKGEDGKYHLPVWMSPEYKLAANNNYNLAGCRFVFGALIELAERYRIEEPLLPVWKDRLEHLVDYPVDARGYMVGTDVPFTSAHRHWSHLQMIFPYYLVDLDDPATRALAEKSIENWTSAEPTQSFYGWSAAAAASLHAAVGNGNEALKWLLVHHNDDRFVMPNTMYLEGHPVIESGTLSTRSLQDMLIQSHNGIIRVFPAVPDNWQDAGFHDLRAEGSFLVSALRREGKTQWVRIKSLAGEPCLLRADFDGVPRVAGTKDVSLTAVGENTWSLQLEQDGEVMLRAGGKGNPVLRPLKTEDSSWNYYGINPKGKSPATYEAIVKKAIEDREETY